MCGGGGGGVYVCMHVCMFVSVCVCVLWHVCACVRMLLLFSSSR